MEADIGFLFPFAGNFPPRGFATCDGQILPISQNAALFSIIGTTYGGNGINTFALPDLRGRTPIHRGQGPGLLSYPLGQSDGIEAVTLTLANLPAHNHPLMVSNAAGTSGVPANNTAFAKGAASGAGPNAVVAKTYTTAAPDTAIAAASVGSSGSALPVSTRSPFVVITWLIATEGIFPSRN